MKIALISHNGKKPEMVSFVLGNKKLFEGIELVGTGTTGGHIENAGFTITKLLSGPLGVNHSSLTGHRYSFNHSLQKVLCCSRICCQRNIMHIT
jgi:hypothetical protein